MPALGRERSVVNAPSVYLRWYQPLDLVEHGWIIDPQLRRTATHEQDILLLWIFSNDISEILSWRQTPGFVGRQHPDEISQHRDEGVDPNCFELLEVPYHPEWDEDEGDQEVQDKGNEQPFEQEIYHKLVKIDAPGELTFAKGVRLLIMMDPFCRLSFMAVVVRH